MLIHWGPGPVAVLVLVVTVGATLLGVCALLVTRTEDRAREVAAARASGTEVTAYTVEIAGPDAASVAGDTEKEIALVVAVFPATVFVLVRVEAAIRRRLLLAEVLRAGG